MNNERRQVARRCVGEAVPCWVDHCIDHRCNLATVDFIGESAQLRQNTRRIGSVQGVRTKRTPQLTHGGSRRCTPADDVADGKANPSCRKRDRLVPVTTSFGFVRGGQVPDGERNSLQGRKSERQEAALKGERDRALGLVTQGA